MADRHAVTSSSGKRPRARMETTTPNKKSRRRSGSSSSMNPRQDDDAVMPETKIVWKDSPVEKQIKVSGTGKLAVRKEMQGFVGRLARASIESSHHSAGASELSSSPPDHHSRDHLFNHTFAKRKTAVAAYGSDSSNASAAARGFSSADEEGRTLVGGINRGASADTGTGRTIWRPETTLRRANMGTPPRHNAPLLSSMKDNSARHHAPPNNSSSPAPKSDSQDELFMILDKIDEKYSSQEGDLSGPEPMQPIPVSSLTTPSRVASSASRVVAVAAATPPHTAQSLVSSTTSNGSAGRAQALQYSTPERNISAQTTPAVIQESPECGSPLTEESWDLLDQLEFQATQRIAASQDAECSQAQVQVNPPPPSRSHAPSTNQNSWNPPPVSPRTPSNQVVVGNQARRADQQQQQNGDQDDFKRFLVLEVDCDMYNRRLILRLLDDYDKHVEAVLADDWFDSMIEAGDTINIVFTERDRAGFFSQDVANHSTRHPSLSSVIQVDNEQNIIILHPDVLVSPTSVTTSFGCLRRAILRETLNVNRPTHQKAFLGTLKHDLFEKALLQGENSIEFLLRESQNIINNNIIGLVECGLNEQTALMELKNVTEDYKNWMIGATNGNGVKLNEPPPATGATVKVHKILATEEMMWSIKWGLKGATDASVEATFLSNPRGFQNTTTGKVVLPLELKTGSKVYAGVEHQGQVILYTLLLNERYRQKCQDGLLMYVPGIETNRISAMATHIRGLIIARNKFASSMAKVKALGSSASSQVFPPMLRSRRDCERCFQIDECVLHHAAVENGTGDSSGLDELFTNKISHLSEADLSYFKRWNRMIELEQQHAEKNLRALWLQVGWKREQDLGNSTCIASLKLVLNEPTISDQGASRMLRFQRDPRRSGQLSSQRIGSSTPLFSFLELGFRADDRIILSAESLDGKKLLVHVARGKVLGLDQNNITLEVYQAIPSIVTNGKSSVGKDFTWRLDKDSIMTGLSRAKENLVRLFIGPPPEVVKVGTNPDGRPEIKALLPAEGNPQSNSGDTRRRNLTVHLTRPRFKSCRVSDLVTQRCKVFERSRNFVDVDANGRKLLDEFFRLNIDQQRAVQKVLNSLDYTLVLGMPGTGKTSTIAFGVRILLFLGFSVLVTSYTHSAVDNLLLKLLEHNLPMLRIGNPMQVHPQLADMTLERQATIHGIASVKEMESLIQGAQLVGCTCLSVNSHVLFRKRRFDFCIVDEATQTTQPVVMGALSCADTFVLVGDHYQLPPLVASAQARKEGMDVSLFRHLSEAHPAAVQQLSFQYRMNADIMLLANRLVYGGKLKCGSFQVASNHLRVQMASEAVGKRRILPWPLQILTNNQGVMFLDTDGLDSTTESVVGAINGVAQRGRRRMENLVEAQLVVGLVELLVCGGVQAEEVAVISPFRSQVSLISNQIAAAPSRNGLNRLNLVEVSTIDKYQGKDKDVILVSFVRSNEENQVGELLTDWRRINVALTRAKQKLVLVGSLSTLSGGSPLFNVLSQVIQERRWQFQLAKNALTVLEGSVHDARKMRPAVKRSEPEPEQEQESFADDGYSEVSVLHPSDDNDDIEGLVPNITRVQNHFPRRSAPGGRQGNRQSGGQRQQQQQQQMEPITRDIFGAM